MQPIVFLIIFYPRYLQRRILGVHPGTRVICAFQVFYTNVLILCRNVKKLDLYDGCVLTFAKLSCHILNFFLSNFFLIKSEFLLDSFWNKPNGISSKTSQFVKGSVVLGANSAKYGSEFLLLNPIFYSIVKLLKVSATLHSDLQ